MRNWSSTYEFRAAGFEEPTTIERVQALVAGADRVRAIGTRHSFNSLADTPGLLVSTTRIPPEIELDERARTVTVGAGTRYAELARDLQRAGWALHNLGSLPHISIGGALSTGTHGSGDGNGSLSTAVRGLTFVTADGGLVTVRRGEEDFAGSVVALGLLGVLVRVTLAVEPTYLVRQDVYRGLTWDTLLADPAAVSGAAYSVSVFTRWVDDQVGDLLVKRRVADPAEPVPEALLGATRSPGGSRRVLAESEDNTTERGVAGPWSELLPHFRIDRTPSAGEEIQSEYFVDRSDAAAALAAVRGLGARLDPHLLISELRTVAADDLWLSMATGRDSLGIHFTWRDHPDDVVRLTGEVEAALAPFAPRPHWGKVHTVDPATIAHRYPRLDAFRDLVSRRDPDGVFAGPHTDRLLGLASGPGPRVTDRRR